jgi:hypothetical protein
MDKRYGKEVTGACKICQAKGKTEMHHIISKSQIMKMKQPDLLTNPNNIIELCKKCHYATDSHLYRRWFLRQERKPKASIDNEIYSSLIENYQKKGLFQCKGRTTIGGRRCRKSVRKEGGFCGTHIWQKEIVELVKEIPNDYP